MATKRRPLGKPLPRVKDTDNTAPTAEQVDRTNALWDSVVPAKWLGMLDAKPLGWTGTPKPRFFYDEITQTLTRANGVIVTIDERRRAYLAFQDALK